MDYATLCQAIEEMNDEQLFLIEKKVSEERERRLAVSLASTQNGAREVRVLIDLAPLTNAVREKLRHEMSLASEATLASIVDQIRDYSDIEESIVIHLMQSALTAVTVYEARCEMKRRLDSVK